MRARIGVFRVQGFGMLGCMHHNSPGFQAALEAAFHAAIAYLDALEDRPVAAAAGVSALRKRLSKPLDDRGLDAEEVVRDLVRDAQDGILGTTGGRFFAWAIGGCVPAALAADWLTSAWDQNAVLYATSPAAAVVEEVAGEWLKELLGIPRTASFAFVSGCQMAHLTCLAAARHALLENRGWDVERRGLCGSPPIRVLASNRHGSIERAIRLLGIGEDNVQDLELNENQQITPQALSAALAAAAGTATVVVLQAGDLNSGSFDEYGAVIPVAKQYGAWVHVDGAFGLWAGASPRYRHFLAGVEAADSWATDGHKWLNVPHDSGYAFVARPAAHRAAMSHRAPYLVHDRDARDEMDWNPEWSRRARGFSTYAALRELGRDGVTALVDGCCAHASAMVDGIGRLPGAQVLWRPSINQGLVRFLDPSGADHDRRTDDVIGAINASGEAFFGGTT
ncbi:MAG TPA: pyridoxal-dependent decarboxylase, partial [Bryobacteraceae bacterium]|nr:pyridoxal-dependent decarboxylase [Bryobacteraceae bacterium]